MTFHSLVSRNPRRELALRARCIWRQLLVGELFKELQHVEPARVSRGPSGREDVIGASALVTERDRRLLAEETYPVTEAGIAARIADGVTAVPEGFDGNLPNSAVAPILIRRVQEPDVALELASCRNVNQAAGLYRDGTLVLSARDDSTDGPHAIDWYQLVRRDNRWQVRQSEGFGFGDCFVRDDWPSEISEWKLGTAWSEL